MHRPPRIFQAHDILSGRVSLDGYPFRYVCLSLSASVALGTAFSGRHGANARMDQLLSAAEFLETRGWEVLNIEHGGTLLYLRRRM
jgi:hypothetical protein